jgi:hypothetical protein
VWSQLAAVVLAVVAGSAAAARPSTSPLERQLAASNLTERDLRAFGSSSGTCAAVAASERVSCMGWWERWLNGAECEARGCCFGPSLDTLNWCYYPTANTAAVTTVHVVQGCHLDVGFMVRLRFSERDTHGLWHTRAVLYTAHHCLYAV